MNESLLTMLVDELSEHIADKVAAKVIAAIKADRGDWPAVETKVDEIDAMPLVTNDSSSVDESTIAKGEVDASEIVKPTEEEMTAHSDRKSELSSRRIDRLRREAAAVGVLDDSHNLNDYQNIDKAELVDAMVTFETIVGKTVDEMMGNVKKVEKVEEEPEEVPDDTDLETPEPADDEEDQELTREVALTLDVATLKSIAIDNDIPASELKGLDVEALVDLLLPEEPAAEPEAESNEEEDSDDEGGWTKEEIEGASLAELKELAEQLNEQGAEIEVTRSTTQEELAAEIIELVF